MKTYRLKRCEVCGTEYQPTDSRQKYCPECGPAVMAEQSKVSNARYRKANPEKRKAADAKYYKAHPNREKYRVYSAKYREANPEKVRAKDATYREVNLEKCKATVAKWIRENPERRAVSDSKWRSLKHANTPVSEMLTSTEWLAILAAAAGHCHYCDKEAKLTLDHVIPLSKGGKHSANNVVPACKHCNSSKRDKTLEEWNKSTRALEAARG